MNLSEKSEYLYRQGVFPKIHAFVNTQLRRKKSKKALEYTLNQFYLKYKKDGLYGITPWAYCQTIINKTSGNFYERELVKKAQDQKRQLMDLVNQGHFDQLISGIG